MKDSNSTLAYKSDHGKAKISLVPTRIIWDIAAIREYGNNKYPEGGPDNWTKVEKQRYKDAMCRHLLGYLEDAHGIDEESGFPHLWHLACNVAFLCEMEDMHLSKNFDTVLRLRHKFKNTPNAEPDPIDFTWKFFPSSDFTVEGIIDTIQKNQK